MRLRLHRARFVIGLRGFALLRGWPFGSAETGEAHLDAIRKALAVHYSESDKTLIEVDELDARDAYASWAETYGDWNPLVAPEEPAVRRFLDGLDAGLALDAACGTGRVAGMLSDLGHRVVAFDASPQMLAHARVSASHPIVLQADAVHIPIRDATFDLVVCALALTHVAELHEPISELARVLRPGGRLVVSDIHPVAAATGAHAFFVGGNGSRGVTRNEVHWPSSYVNAFNSAGLVIEGVAEPSFDESFLGEMQEPSTRDAAREAVVGLPFALVWRVRKT